MSDSCGVRLWAFPIQRNPVIAVIPVSAFQIALMRWHSRKLFYIYCEGILCLLVMVGYIQIGLRSMQNIMLSILYTGIAWGGLCHI